MNECAEKNEKRKQKYRDREDKKNEKHGRRYDPDYVSYCSYLLLTGGTKTYQSMKSNNKDGMPSIYAVKSAVHKTKSTIIEGTLRHNELLVYLKSMNLPMYVSLSEDATNITGMVEYFSPKNQIVGLVQPLNEENAIPIPLAYEATSATAIENIMLAKKVPTSCMFNVVMAQPLASKVPAFCLMAYGGTSSFTKEQVAKRWMHIVEELENIGIKVVTFSSDADPRYNGAMKDLIFSCPADKSDKFPGWFEFDCSIAKYFPIQDTVHIGTKLRNRILTNDLMFGQNEISVDHIRTLVQTVSRDQHGLYELHVNQHDKMNFISVQKITDQKVIQLLGKFVNRSSGTVLYLKITDMILRAFLDMSLSNLERIKYMWYALFILRIWRKSVLQTPGRKLADHFITSYTYTCVEINAHSLVAVMLYLKTSKLEHLFMPHLMSSQPCESQFREIRSQSSLGSTVINCSVLDMIRRCETIEKINDISRSKLPDFSFETITSRSREIYYGSTSYKETTLPTQNEIFDAIEAAKKDAIKDAKELGVEMDQDFDYTCELIHSGETKKTKPIPQLKRQDGDELKQFQALHLTDYSQKIKTEKFSQISPYVKVNDIGLGGAGRRVIYVRKQQLISLYMERRTKLSADRRKRVQDNSPCIRIGEEETDALEESDGHTVEPIGAALAQLFDMIIV